MTDRNWSKTTLYKYRKFDSRTLSMLINKELYFASPEDLNDPYDCQISISKSIEEAITIAKKRHPGALTLEKINLLAKLTTYAPKMERDIKSTGIYSLSRTSTNVLMWTHYSGEHRGLCIGVRLPGCMLTYNSQAKIVGTNICGYFANNPFVNYYNEIVTANEIIKWNDFWFRVFGIDLVAKHNSWRYEKEVRIVRREPGVVAIGPQNIVEIIFGVNMPIENMKTVTKLLSGEEWAHIKYSKMTKYSESFRLMKKEMSRLEIDHIRAGRFEMV
jgi:hypothetical protein